MSGGFSRSLRSSAMVGLDSHEQNLTHHHPSNN